MPPRDPQPRAPADSRTEPKRLLALGSAGLTGLGLVLLAVDVFSQEQRPAGWYALVAGALGLLAAGFWSGFDDAPARRAPPRITGTGHRRLVHGSAPAAPAAKQRALGRVARLIAHRDTKYRPHIAAAAAVVLLVQAAIPLRYYLGDDKYDERYAWRMFSAVRMHQCDVEAFETVDGHETPVVLNTTVQVGWVTTFERQREDSIERYLRWRCDQEGVTSARLVNQCTSPSGARVPPIVRRIDCGTGEIEREGGL